LNAGASSIPEDGGRTGGDRCVAAPGSGADPGVRSADCGERQRYVRERPATRLCALATSDVKTAKDLEGATVALERHAVAAAIISEPSYTVLAQQTPLRMMRSAGPTPTTTSREQLSPSIYQQQ